MTPGVRDPAGVERLADLVARAVTGCPGVAALSPGPVATYLPGRTVGGVAVRDGGLEVAVVAKYGPPLAEIAAQVRAAVEPLAPGAPVDVRFDDIAPPEPDSDSAGRTASPQRPGKAPAAQVEGE